MLLYVFPSQARYGIVYFIDKKGEIRTKNQVVILRQKNSDYFLCILQGMKCAT